MADDHSRAGGGYATPEIREFIEQVHVPADDGLAHALRAIEQAGMPRIQVAPLDGAILRALLAIVGARSVVEIGTLAGYSALWMLKALPADGRLITIEADPVHAGVARGVFARAGVADRVRVVEGRALDVLPQVAGEGPFDAVFLDADKGNYDRYAEWALDHLRPGGLVIADNAYLFGYLAGREPDGEHDAATIEAVRRMHRLLAERTLSVCLPTPDGLAVGMVPR